MVEEPRTVAASILCIMRMPPDVNGHGGSQRALRLLEALLPHGQVHFVLVYRDQDFDCVNTRLDHIFPMVASVTKINIEEWQGTGKRMWGFIPRKLCDVFRMGSQEAPRLSRRQLSIIANHLPRRRFDIVFAGRVCSAFIVQALIDQGLLSVDRRIVDFDDIMSKFRLRQVRTSSAMSLGERLAGSVDSLIIRLAERRLALTWDAVSVCTAEDVASLKTSYPTSHVSKIPNVVDLPLLRPRPSDGCFRILFVGNLSFSANTDGLLRFAKEGWGHLSDRVPKATLTIVGLNPTAEVRNLAREFGFSLRANVPTLKTFYEACDVVIAPILFGSGTRIKILEAMAYGRPVVSTTMGAEGMGLINGEHLLIADTMVDFAKALVRIAQNPSLGAELAVKARQFQQIEYTPETIRRSVSMILQT